MQKNFWRVAAWLLLIGIAVATLGPIGIRPVTGEPPQLERLVAYMLMGAAFALAYPRQFWVISIGIVVVAGALEALQLVDPGRHGQVPDFLAKAAGGLIGVVCATLLSRMVRQRLPKA
ncbi:MAG TPA: VanZ family protein [Arsenicitalea sp.]|jgi:VanZ family protein|nr:VanZ family protein [Arsenicitalea sp.]